FTYLALCRGAWFDYATLLNQDGMNMAKYTITIPEPRVSRTDFSLSFVAFHCLLFSVTLVI
ncbi:MAG: hypothetical protein ACI9WC_003109, partial [Arenicella sp.]